MTPPSNFTENSTSMCVPESNMDYRKDMMASLLAIKHSKKFVKTSESYCERYEKALPKLAPSEIEIGSLLGRGGFSNVYEISSFPLTENHEKEDADQRESREFLKTNVFRDRSGDCRYAIKYLRQDIINDERMFKMAAIDLAVEAKILCSVFHPNVVKLRGLCADGEKGFRSGKPEGFFLVIDRLYDTLAERIVQWRKYKVCIPEKRVKIFRLDRFFCKKVQSSEIPNHKLKIILDITAALQYLHKRKILYRDLKPENLGFDVRGDIKLFDFGLSTELSNCKAEQDGTYKLTGCIGSLRYMAPEVVKNESYNLSADIYSFSILLWEILTLETPFEGMDRKEFMKLVASGTSRPHIPRSIPLHVRNLLEEGWSSDLHNRPSFDWIFGFFAEMMSSQSGILVNLSHARRRRSSELMFRASITNGLVN